jgi:hypothetical protein
MDKDADGWVAGATDGYGARAARCEAQPIAVVKSKLTTAIW